MHHTDPFEPLQHLKKLELNPALELRIKEARYVRPLHLWASAAMIIVLLGLQLITHELPSNNSFTVSPSEQLYHEGQ